MDVAAKRSSWFSGERSKDQVWTRKQVLYYTRAARSPGLNVVTRTEYHVALRKNAQAWTGLNINECWDSRMEHEGEGIQMLLPCDQWTWLYFLNIYPSGNVHLVRSVVFTTLTITMIVFFRISAPRWLVSDSAKTHNVIVIIINFVFWINSISLLNGIS